MQNPPACTWTLDSYFKVRVNAVGNFHDLMSNHSLGSYCQSVQKLEIISSSLWLEDDLLLLISVASVMSGDLNVGSVDSATGFWRGGWEVSLGGDALLTPFIQVFCALPMHGLKVLNVILNCPFSCKAVKPHQCDTFLSRHWKHPWALSSVHLVSPYIYNVSSCWTCAKQVLSMTEVNLTLAQEWRQQFLIQFLNFPVD